MIHLTSNVALCLSSVPNAKISYHQKQKNLLFFSMDVDEPGESSFSIQLADIHNFVTCLKRTLRQNHDKVLVACVKAHDALKIANISILIGAYMILAVGMDVEQVARSFKPIVDCLKCVSYASKVQTKDARTFVLDSWIAIQKVRSLRWLDFSDDALYSSSVQTLEPTMDIDEHTHYADPANGGLHIIVPGRLILMPSPIEILESRDWIDAERQRRFSPAFYADLLEAEFSASIVLRLSYDGDTMEYNPAAFEDRGIAVEGIPLGPRGAAQHHLLSAADRLIANLRGAPGAVAVQTHGASADAGGCVGTLLATGLMSVFGFGAGDAAAWLRLTCPPPCAAPAQLSTVFHGVTAAAAALNDLRGGLWRTASAPVPAACAAPSRPAWPNKLLRSLSS